MVDTELKLQNFLPTLRAATWVAVDTEADSLHAYPEKVCLIQISTHAGDRLVDPLAGFDLAPLLEALTAHELIMHGADYDLRLLRKHHEFVPKAIFDTMLAARLLGMRQFGLSHLTETCLGVKLEKGPQKANWAMRPLTERMERYARNDTHYLKPLADKLRQDLTLKGRLGWHQEACAHLVADCMEEKIVDSDAVWRVKGSHLLGRPGLAVLRELWHWRETEAKAANKPPFFVVSHETLVEIAAAAATHRPVDQLLPKRFSERRRAGVLQAVNRGLDAAPDQHPKILRSTGRRPSDAERRRYLELQKKRDQRAAELDLDPTLIASRGALSDLAHDWDKHSADLMKWQFELLK
ncbi:MAG TPA: HRDC domain-containing protein [Verrucomicrobiae bacterium]|nr:HRDC domain-containing protein [Verrucomicrobiae bacterium]